MKVVQLAQTGLYDEIECAVECDIHHEIVRFSVDNLVSVNPSDIIEVAHKEVKKCPQCIAEMEAKKPKHLMWPEGAEL